MQNSMRKLKLTLTLTLTLTDTGGVVLTLMLGYRSLYIIHGNSGYLRCPGAVFSYTLLLTSNGIEASNKCVCPAPGNLHIYPLGVLKCKIS